MSLFMIARCPTHTMTIPYTWYTWYVPAIVFLMFWFGKFCLEKNRF